MADIEQLRVPVGDMTFDVRAAGPEDGRLVVLLHGFPQTSHSWRAQLHALADAGYRAVAPDQRGYSPGARPTAVQAYAVSHLVADVVAIADSMGGHRFDLVGHDWGGMVAWWLAAAYPDRLRSLTVLSTPHPAALRAAYGSADSDQSQRSSYVTFFRQEGVAEEAMLADDARVLRQLYATTGLPDEDAAVYLDAMTQPGALTAGLSWYRANDLDAIDGMGPVTAPTLYIWSTNDPALGPDAAEATAQHVEGPYRFEVIEGASHWVAEERADDVNRLLLEHLGGSG